MLRSILCSLLLLVASASAQLTPQLNFNIPVAGTPNWNALLNSNFTLLDNYLSGQNTFVLPALNVLNLNVSGTTTGVSTTLQNSTIANHTQTTITNAPIVSICGGGHELFSVNYFLEVTQASVGSSSLTLTFNWTDETGARTLSLSPMNTNAVGQVANFTQSFHCTSGQITYTATYSSLGGAPQMQYQGYFASSLLY